MKSKLLKKPNISYFGLGKLHRRFFDWKVALDLTINMLSFRWKAQVQLKRERARTCLPFMILK